jgi:hypothetical protein
MCNNAYPEPYYHFHKPIFQSVVPSFIFINAEPKQIAMNFDKMVNNEEEMEVKSDSVEEISHTHFEGVCNTSPPCIEVKIKQRLNTKKPKIPKKKNQILEDPENDSEYQCDSESEDDPDYTEVPKPKRRQKKRQKKSAQKRKSKLKNPDLPTLPPLSSISPNLLTKNPKLVEIPSYFDKEYLPSKPTSVIDRRKYKSRLLFSRMSHPRSFYHPRLHLQYDLLPHSEFFFPSSPLNIISEKA